MSSQQETPSAEPAGAEGTATAEGTPTGAEAEAGTPEVEGSSEGTPAGREPYDQDAVIRDGGDAAEKQYKDVQRALSRATSQLKKYEPLNPYIDQLGGGRGALNQLARLDRMMGNPRMSKMVQRFEETGSLPTELGGYEELEEETDPRDVEIRDLKASLSRIEGRVGQQDIKQHFVALKKEFADDWDELQPVIEQQLVDWQQDPGARQVLNNMNYDTLHLLALKTLYGNEDGRAKRAQRYNQRLVDSRKARSTDAPSVTATTGRETPTGQHAHVMDAWQEFKEMEGLTGEIRYLG